MAVYKFRWPRAALILTGQSLWDTPADPDSVASKIILGRDVTSYRAWRGGWSWQQIATTPNQLTRVTRNAQAAPLSILVMMGGTTDITVGGSGAATYTYETAISEAFRAAGGTYVIGTTTTPSTSFSGPQNTQLADLNSRVTGDASHAFDAVVNLAADPSLDDPADTTYYSDGTHPTAAGATVIANLLGAAVDTLIATHPSPQVPDYLLTEDGDYLLLETGEKVTLDA